VAILETRVDRGSPEFEANRARMEELVAELRERVAAVAAGGGAEAVEKHRSRGKLLARERIEGLLDPDSAFLELNALAAWELYEREAPGGGIVTGIGERRHGQGRHLLPPHREKAPAGAGSRRPE
jgi:3-methylcrotonyl-CoA carboxylase beta subunit